MYFFIVQYVREDHICYITVVLERTARKYGNVERVHPALDKYKFYFYEMNDNHYFPPSRDNERKMYLFFHQAVAANPRRELPYNMTMFTKQHFNPNVGTQQMKRSGPTALLQIYRVMKERYGLTGGNDPRWDIQFQENDNYKSVHMIGTKILLRGLQYFSENLTWSQEALFPREYHSGVLNMADNHIEKLAEGSFCYCESHGRTQEYIAFPCCSMRMHKECFFKCLKNNEDKTDRHWGLDLPCPNICGTSHKKVKLCQWKQRSDSAGYDFLLNDLNLYPENLSLVQYPRITTNHYRFDLARNYNMPPDFFSDWVKKEFPTGGIITIMDDDDYQHNSSSERNDNRTGGESGE